MSIVKSHDTSFTLTIICSREDNQSGPKMIENISNVTLPSGHVSILQVEKMPSEAFPEARYRLFSTEIVGKLASISNTRKSRSFALHILMKLWELVDSYCSTTQISPFAPIDLTYAPLDFGEEELDRYFVFDICVGICIMVMLFIISLKEMHILKIVWWKNLNLCKIRLLLQYREHGEERLGKNSTTKLVGNH